MKPSAGWQLKIRKKAWKAFVRLPGKDRNRLLETMGELALNPYAGDIEKMKGEVHHWRRRMGAYRIFYEIIPDDRVIYVFRIERRTSKTY